MRCGDVWACPHCRNAVMAERQESIKKIGEWALETDQWVYHVTLTYRHHRRERPMWASDEVGEERWLAWRLGEERRALTDAWRKFTGGRDWADFAFEYGWTAVRSIEVTHGSHGWHPHLHCFVTSRLPIDAFVWEALARKWCASFDDERRGDPKVALCVRRLSDYRDVENVATYLTKGVESMAAEVASPTGKKSREGVTPWQLLGSSEGDVFTTRKGQPSARTLWRAYTLGMLGARAVTFPRNLVRMLELRALTDLEAAWARDEAPEPECVIGVRTWNAIRSAKAWALVDALCAVVCEGGDVRAHLAEHWPAHWAHDVVLRSTAPPPVECLPRELWDVAFHLARFPGAEPGD